MDYKSSKKKKKAVIEKVLRPCFHPTMTQTFTMYPFFFFNQTYYAVQCIMSLTQTGLSEQEQYSLTGDEMY